MSSIEGLLPNRCRSTANGAADLAKSADDVEIEVYARSTFSSGSVVRGSGPSERFSLRTVTRALSHGCNCDCGSRTHSAGLVPRAAVIM
jgi:hypothetical protein